MEKEEYKYKVIGEYPTVCNGFPSYVIVEFLVKSKEEAEKIRDDRVYRYKNLRIEKC